MEIHRNNDFYFSYIGLVHKRLREKGTNRFESSEKIMRSDSLTRIKVSYGCGGEINHGVPIVLPQVSRRRFAGSDGPRRSPQPFFITVA